MRIKRESYPEYIDLIELDYPVSDTTGLKQIRPLRAEDKSTYKTHTVGSNKTYDIQKMQDSVSNNLQEVVYHMIG